MENNKKNQIQSDLFVMKTTAHKILDEISLIRHALIITCLLVIFACFKYIVYG